MIPEFMLAFFNESYSMLIYFLDLCRKEQINSTCLGWLLYKSIKSEIITWVFIYLLIFDTNAKSELFLLLNEILSS